CFRRRRVVFSLSKKVFRNRYALMARTIPFNTSLLNSKKVPIVVHPLSLKNKKRILRDNRHPYNFWLHIYFIISEQNNQRKGNVYSLLFLLIFIFPNRLKPVIPLFYFHHYEQSPLRGLLVMF